MMEIIRGDTKKYKFQRKDANGEVITTRADKIYFTVKESEFSLEPVIQKTIDDMTFDDDGTYHFTILPSETDDLRYDTYCYDIERIQDGDKKTISFGKFIINPEVTFARNEV